MFPALALTRARVAPHIPQRVQRRAFRTLSKRQLRSLLQLLEAPGRREAISRKNCGDVIMDLLAICDADRICGNLEKWLISANLLGDQTAEIEDSLDSYVVDGKFLLDELAELVDFNHARNMTRFRPPGGGDWDEIVDRAADRAAPPSRLFRGFPDSFQQRPRRKM
ncbi:hypothetical protein M885DRAFT_529632, partial [Pelagophyceae sp. CCMP2097]